MIIRQIVIVVMVLWVMHSFIVYQYHRYEIQLYIKIHVYHRHVCRVVFVMYMEMLRFVICVQMKMDTIIQDVDQNVYQIVIVNLVELVLINVVWIHAPEHVAKMQFVPLLIIIQFVHVHMDYMEIHLNIVPNQFDQFQRFQLDATRHNADQTPNVANKMVFCHVFANEVILVIH